MHKLEKSHDKSLNRSGKIPSATLNGVGIHFIDSYLFVNVPLTKMPKAFGIEELLKGYFPYKFLRSCNRDYRPNKMPLFETFDPYRLSKIDFEKFIKWYQKEEQRLVENPHAVYDLEAELVKYCQQDVTVLRCCMEGFRCNVMDLFSNVDPFEKITLPSYFFLL